MLPVTDAELQHIEECWGCLNTPEKIVRLKRGYIMSGGRIVTGILLGLAGAVLTSAVIAIVSGVATLQSLWWLVLGVFTGLTFGYVLGVRKSM